MISITIRDIRVGLLFGLFGALLITIFLLLTAFLTPGFTPFNHPISALGHSKTNSLYGFGLIVGGSALIPFYIYLEQVLLNINMGLRGLITSVAIFTNICVALVGLPPDPINVEAFQTLHAFVSVVGLIGTSILIVFYSIMMHKSSKPIRFKGPIFKKYLIVFGFVIGGVLGIFLITKYSMLEWIVGALIVSWIFITALQGIPFKFSKTHGIFYKKSQKTELLSNSFKEKFAYEAGMSVDDLSFQSEKVISQLGLEKA
ncbi:MAG: DUF998 domain-containing protein [Promethearchaeota archaeon]